MFEIIGIEIVDYLSKKTNRQVVGKKFYAYRPIASSRGDGYETEVFFCSDRMSAYSIVSIGDTVRPIYNKYGNLDDLIVEK